MSASRRVENLTASPILFLDLGIELAAFGTYDITPEEHPLWANSDDVKTSFDAGDIKFINLGVSTVAQLVMENGQSVSRIKSNQEYTIPVERVLVTSELNVEGLLIVEGALVAL